MGETVQRRRTRCAVNSVKGYCKYKPGSRCASEAAKFLQFNGAIINVHLFPVQVYTIWVSFDFPMTFVVEIFTSYIMPS